MQIIIHTKNIDLTPAIKNYTEEKVGLLKKFLNENDYDLTEARVEVGKPSQHHKTGSVFYAEINLKVGTHLFRGSAEHEDLYTAINNVRNEVEKQIKKFKEKAASRRRIMQ